MQLYTRKGDEGETEIFGGDKISKSDIKVWCYGTVDELSAYLGVTRAFSEDSEINQIILHIQNQLLTLSSQLASNEKSSKLLKNKISQEDVSHLEKLIDKYSDLVGEITNFVISGESKLSSNLHFSRTIARRCERLIVNLDKEEKIDDFLLKYINRLSDLFFVLALFTE